jgi:hypothetical protein
MDLVQKFLYKSIFYADMANKPPHAVSWEERMTWKLMINMITPPFGHDACTRKYQWNMGNSLRRVWPIE